MGLISTRTLTTHGGAQEEEAATLPGSLETYRLPERPLRCENLVVNSTLLEDGTTLPVIPPWIINNDRNLRDTGVAPQIKSQHKKRGGKEENVPANRG